MSKGNKLPPFINGDFKQSCYQQEEPHPGGPTDTQDAQERDPICA